MHNKSILLFCFLIVCIALPVRSSFANRILWDVSHTPFGQNDLEGSYVLLSRILENNGYEIREGEEAIDRHGLWDADILVISILSNYQNAYTEAEVERIAAFVEGGGGLIILADNSQTRPRNISLLLREFGFWAAEDDDIEDLIRFIDHPVTEGLDSVSFFLGSAVDVEEGNSILAWDDQDLGGIAINEERGGPVILIGDADLWTIFDLGRLDNTQLALNCFQYADREPQGRIEVEFDDPESFMVEDSDEEFGLTTLNHGEGALEVGFRIQNEPQWISVSTNYVLLQPDERIDAVISINTAGLQPGQELNATLVVNHNDPTSDPVEIEYTLHVLPNEPVHFVLPDPTGYDHSLLIRGLTIAGEPARCGLEVGVFTPGGLCGGGAVYMGEILGFPARGDDPMTEEIEGFTLGEPFSFQIYLPWEDRVIGTTPAFEQGASVFRNDGLSILSLDGRPNAELTLNLSYRWNLISLNVRPVELDFIHVFAPMIENNELLMIKDGDGRFWNLARGFNNLHDWDLTRGYEIRVAHPTELLVEGVEVDPQIPIHLEFGWSIIPFLPQEPQRTADALTTIHDHLRFMKRDDGAFYVPAWEWDGIGALEPGEGYKVKLNAVDVLIYPVAHEEDDEVESMSNISFTPAPSGVDMSLLLLGLPPETDVRLLGAGNNITGQGKTDCTGRLGLPAWGDDPTTIEIEGLKEGETFVVQVRDKEKWLQPEIEWIEKDNRYFSDEFAVGKLLQNILIPKRLDVSCYPNPFNERVTVSFNVAPGEKNSIRIFDLSGRTLALINNALTGSNESHAVTFKADEWPAGVIFFQIRQGDQARLIKAVHLP